MKAGSPKLENYNKTYTDITTSIKNVVNNGALSKLAKYEDSSFFGFMKSTVENDDAIAILKDLEEECEKLLGPIDNIKKKSICIFLEIKINNLVERLNNNYKSRPLLKNGDIKKKREKTQIYGF